MKNKAPRRFSSILLYKIPLDSRKEESTQNSNEESESIKLMHTADFVLDQGEHSPQEISCWEEVIDRKASHEHGQRNLHHDESYHINSIQIVQFIAIQSQVFFHATDLCSARCRGVQNLRPVCQEHENHNQRIYLENQSSFLGRVGR